MSAIGLPPKRLAERMGKGIATLARWRARGEGPPFIAVGKCVYYPEDQYERWLKKHTRGELV